MEKIRVNVLNVRKAEVFFFLVAGSAGFCTDVAIVWLLTRHGIHALAAQAFAFSCAVVITWLINRRYTFRAHARPDFFAEFIHYLGANIVGAIVTNGLYAVLVLNSTTFLARPELAVAVGAIAGLVFNFISMKWFVFRSR